MIYRVYIAGREFGIDYTRAEALRVAAQYRAWLPGAATTPARYAHHSRNAARRPLRPAAQRR